MPKTIVLICLCFLKCIAIVSSQSKITLPIVEKNWSVDLRDGWNAALFLHPDHKGTKIGTFFWLFDKQPITWNLKEGILTIQFKDAWREFSDDSAILKFKHTPDGLKLLTEGMSKNEKQLLEGTIFKSGGKSPQQLADFRNRKSPYSKFHVKASLTINPNIIPLGLAETALKIHQQNKFEIGIISSHRKMPLDILRGLMNTASKTKSIGRRKLISPWQGSSTIMYYMSIHPNLERKDLEVCWNLPFSYSEASIWWNVVNHPKADPAWKDEFIKRINADTKEARRMRSILGRNKDLSLEIIDILIERIKTDKDYNTGDLAAHPKLDAKRMRKIYSARPYLTSETLAKRADTPLDVLQKIVDSKEEAPIAEMLKSAKVPKSILTQAALKISHSDDINRVGFACESPFLSSDRIQKLLTHPEPMIRSNLAKNPELPLPDLKKLTDDNYQSVARSARHYYMKRAGKNATQYITSLRNLDELKTFYSTENEIADAIKNDNPEEFSSLLNNLWLPLGTRPYDHRYEQWTNIAVQNKAYKTMKQWIKQNPEIKTHLIKTNAMLWTPEIASLLLGGKPTTKLLEAYVISIVKTNRSDLLDDYLAKGHSIKVANKQPLLWYAIAHRNEVLARKLLKLGCEPSIQNDRMTPAMLAVQTNYTTALNFLPLTDAQKESLQAFKKQYPGDPNAAWLGTWTNGKSEFKTLAIILLPDGNGRLITATGMGVAIVWKTLDVNNVEIMPIQKGKVIITQKILGHFKVKNEDESLELKFPRNQSQMMKRSDKKKK